MTVVGYTRVSTDQQELSPDAQRHAIEQWARGSGLELGGVYSDEVSGGIAELRSCLEGDRLVTSVPLGDRPGLLGALRFVRDRRATALVVVRRDRVARDVEALRAIGRLLAPAKLIAVGMDPGELDGYWRQLLETLQDAVSEVERGLIRQRTREALAEKRRRGQLVGSVPLGFRVAAHACVCGQSHREVRACPACGAPRLGPAMLERDDDEQRAIARMVELDAQGLGARAIATRLLDEGFLPRRGRRWQPTTITRALQRTQIAGGGRC